MNALALVLLGIVVGCPRIADYPHWTVRRYDDAFDDCAYAAGWIEW